MSYIWTQRQCEGEKPAQQPIEILSAPNVHLFITPESALIRGIVNAQLLYDATVPAVIAGVTFRPGGFYPFFRQPVSRLGEKTTALKPLFPGADERFAAKLTGQSDEVIFAMLEHLLRNKRPVPDKNLDLVTRIMVALEHDETLQTVAAVARVFGKSERSIQLLFQTYVGVGLKWVITRKRLLETVRQVRTHARSNWVEAAAELGYSSQSHFVREFKRIIGRTPSQYLRAMTPAP